MDRYLTVEEEIEVTLQLLAKEHEWYLASLRSHGCTERAIKWVRSKFELEDITRDFTNKTIRKLKGIMRAHDFGDLQGKTISHYPFIMRDN